MIYTLIIDDRGENFIIKYIIYNNTLFKLLQLPFKITDVLTKHLGSNLTLIFNHPKVEGKYYKY